MRFLFILLCLFASSVQARIDVVASIPPLQGITASIMRGAGEPELLIKDQGSAHHFAFRPSHFRALKRADLVIWIDRNFESGFQQLPEILRDSTVGLELLPALGLTAEDGHIWYSPTLLGRIIDQITAALSNIDPQNRAIFQRNRVELRQAISLWAQSMRELIAGGKPRYLLDHKFLSHFETSFGIRPVATINNEHDQHGGIQELRFIEGHLESGSVKCLLSNEASISKTGRNLAEKYGLKIYKITDYSTAENGFMQHLRQLHDALVHCR